VTRPCDRERSPWAPRRVPAPRPLHFRNVAQLTKEEVFDVCGRLAVAHQALLRAGDTRSATELVWVFDLIERRVAG
jgi:hypothetical protein